MKADIFYSANETSRDEVLGADVYWNLKQWSDIDEWISLLLGLHSDILTYASEIKDPDEWFRSVGFPIKSLGSAKNFQKSFPHLLRLHPLIQRFLKEISYYSASQFTDPTKCPVSLEVEDERVRRPRPGDHAKFIHDLYKVYKQDGGSREYREFLSIVGKNGLRLVENITFRKLELPQSTYEVRVGGKVVRKRSQRNLIIPYFTVDDNRLSPNQLSEGTFKTIALLFYLVIDRGGLLNSDVDVAKELIRKT